MQQLMKQKPFKNFEPSIENTASQIYTFSIVYWRFKKSMMVVLLNRMKLIPII